MSEQNITVGFGNANFKTCSATLGAYAVTAPFVRQFIAKTFKRVGAMQRFPSTATPEVNGYLYLDTLTVANGTLILLQLSHRYHGSSLRDGAVVIQLENTGPLLGINAVIPSSIESIVTNRFMAFQGRGYILEPYEFGEVGLSPAPNWSRNYLSPEEIRECFVVIEQAPATSPRKRVIVEVKSDGAEVKTLQKPARIVRIRRNTH